MLSRNLKSSTHFETASTGKNCHDTIDFSQIQTYDVDDPIDGQLLRSADGPVQTVLQFLHHNQETIEDCRCSRCISDEIA